MLFSSHLPKYLQLGKKRILHQLLSYKFYNCINSAIVTLQQHPERFFFAVSLEVVTASSIAWIIEHGDGNNNGGLSISNNTFPFSCFDTSAFLHQKDRCCHSIINSLVSIQAFFDIGKLSM